MKLETKKLIAKEGLFLIGSFLIIWVYWAFRRDAQRLEIVAVWILINFIIRFIFWSIKTLKVKR